MQAVPLMPKAGEFPLEGAWRPMLQDLGVRPADLLRRAQLPEDLLTRPGAALDTASYFRLWASLEIELNDPLFPIKLAEVVTAEAFMPPLFAALCSPNLAVGLQRIARYKRLIAPMAMDLAATRDGIALTLRWLDATTPPPTSLVVTELAFLVRLARIATRQPVRPTAVRTPQPPRPVRAYARFFGVPVQVGKTHTMAFSSLDLQRPFLTANEGMWRTFEPDLRRRLAQLDASATVAERVRAALLEALPSGQASMDAVCGRLAMSKRTLQRRLGEEGHTFQTILARTRQDLARHYLANTAISCGEISFLLGFEDPNSFFRAFHDWTGESPQRTREAMVVPARRSVGGAVERGSRA